jgi:hypothetical protein
MSSMKHNTFYNEPQLCIRILITSKRLLKEGIAKKYQAWYKNKWNQISAVSMCESETFCINIKEGRKILPLFSQFHLLLLPH